VTIGGRMFKCLVVSRSDYFCEDEFLLYPIIRAVIVIIIR